MAEDWKPIIAAAGERPLLPAIGQVVVFAVRYGRYARRVLQIDDVNPANWDNDTAQKWETDAEGDPNDWWGRERWIWTEPARWPKGDDSDRYGVKLSPWARATTEWWALPEMWPECTKCCGVWPCPCAETEEWVAWGVDELDRRNRIELANCWSCNKPIAAQQHVSYDGENLMLPGAGQVIFHIEADTLCLTNALKYEDLWLAADPTHYPRLARIVPRATGEAA